MENIFVVTDRAEMKKKMLDVHIRKHQTVINDLN